LLNQSIKIPRNSNDIAKEVLAKRQEYQQAIDDDQLWQSKLDRARTSHVEAREKIIGQEMHIRDLEIQLASAKVTINGKNEMLILERSEKQKIMKQLDTGFSIMPIINLKDDINVVLANSILQKAEAKLVFERVDKKQIMQELNEGITSFYLEDAVLKFRLHF
jgi:hypothetical protein